MTAGWGYGNRGVAHPPATNEKPPHAARVERKGHARYFACLLAHLPQIRRGPHGSLGGADDRMAPYLLPILRLPLASNTIRGKRAWAARGTRSSKIVPGRNHRVLSALARLASRATCRPGREAVLSLAETFPIQAFFSSFVIVSTSCLARLSPTSGSPFKALNEDK